MPVETESKPTTTKKRATKEVVRSLDRRLLDAWGELHGVVKDGRNDFSGYNYPKADTVIKDCRRALMANGLLLTCTWKYIDSDSIQPTMSICWRLASPDTKEVREEYISFPVCERKGTPKDKAGFGVLTSSYTYYLRALFMLPRVDNLSELDEIDDSKYAPIPELDPKLNTSIGTLHVAMGVVGLDHSLEDVKMMLSSRASAQGRKVDAAFVNECIDKLSERNS
tara:strand:+ start:1639 stop:2310 length:672 start_codon:yes stop_codon:yes gene_type:complete